MRATPHVALRVDASATMGTGHLRRCLSLAQALATLGARVDMVVRRLDSAAPQVLAGPAAAGGWGVRWLPVPAGDFTPQEGGTPHQAWAGVPWDQDVRDTLGALQDNAPDWVVVDHYAFDERWHAAVRRGLGCRVLVIDDVADRALDADALLDQNLAADHHAKYASRLSREPRWLTGPGYALLSVAYRDAPRYRFRPEVRSLGVFLGGTDPGGASARVLGICRNAGFTGPVEVVSTSASPFLDELRAACADVPGATLTLDQPDLAAFFARHDLQIGAGGGATWERCCIGVPTIALMLAANQEAVVPALDQLGVLRAARLDSHSGSVELPVLAQALTELLADPAARQALGEHAAALIDGRGAERVALSLLRDTLALRPARREDGPMLHRWRNHTAVRAVSGSADVIPLADHMAWLQRVLVASDRWLFVAEVGQLPVGSIRFDQVEKGRIVVSLYLDPELLGLGLGQRLLLAGEGALLGRLGGSFTVDADVMPGNVASQHLFEACGYHGGPLRYQKTVGPRPTTQ
ncbi:MAG: UDP-2,4-diacetamido-2,4,6-trideoxy-beta-L-altropyranose hydrolase [Hylemonella sp.]